MRQLRHLISVDDYDRETLESLFDRASYFRDNYGKVEWDILHRKRMLAIFCEPSTRTRFSFEAAMHELGGTSLNAQDAMTSSSFAKDESIQDGIRVLSKYGHIIVLRHKEAGSMRRAIIACDIPFINAGEGTQQHPTQVLPDLFTMKHELGQIDNLTIAMAGDLVNGRTIHSLVEALANFYHNVRMFFISPPQLSIPNDMKQMLIGKQIDFTEFRIMDEVPVSKIDCLYMTRVQKERFDDQRDYDAVRDCCILRPEHVEWMNGHAIILHPLPRVHEIPMSVDYSEHAKYFQQAENGLYVRMALLEHMLT